MASGVIQSERRSNSALWSWEPRDNVALGALAAAAYEARRARALCLPIGLFAEPAWDMLLHLYSADVEGREVPTTSLCIASTAASTTALRHIETLQRTGLIERGPSPRDNRVTLIRLPPGACEYGGISGCDGLDGDDWEPCKRRLRLLPGERRKPLTTKRFVEVVWLCCAFRKTRAVR